MTFEQSIQLYKQIEKVSNDFLKKEFIEKAIDYARIRTDWYFMDTDSRSKDDKSRRIKHDSFIDSINAISRFMAKNEDDNSWYNELPDYRSPAGRKEWGDFACYIHCYIGIRLR